MTRQWKSVWTVVSLTTVLLTASSACAEFITIGNPGNAAASADNTTSNKPLAYGYGAVAYTYQISKSAVSTAEWADFYNDPTSNKKGTFNTTYNFWNDGTRTVGAAAPVVSVSFQNIAQYANWMTTGDATQGAYAIDSNTGAVTSMMSRTEILESGRRYYLIPTENEWYKAAYFKPDASGYTLFAQGADTNPMQSSNADKEIGWVYGIALSAPNSVRPVDFGPEEQNGTHNMMGNVWEFTETMSGTSVVYRGGQHAQSVERLAADFRAVTNQNAASDRGFRLVIVPEPTNVAIGIPGAGIGCIMALFRWRRQKV